jgi:hypothetical protein
MNTTSRICAVALLVALAPLVNAQDASKPAQSTPPQTEPAAPAPTQGEKAKKEVDKAVDAIRDYSIERRDEAMASARQSTEALDQRIEAMQSQMEDGWSRMSQATRTRSEQTMADLRKRRNQLAEWYGGMRHSSVDAWGEVKSGFVTSYHDLAEAMHKAREQFDQERSDEARSHDADKDRK